MTYCCRGQHRVFNLDRSGSVVLFMLSNTIGPHLVHEIGNARARVQQCVILLSKPCRSTRKLHSVQLETHTCRATSQGAKWLRHRQVVTSSITHQRRHVDSWLIAITSAIETDTHHQYIDSTNKAHIFPHRNGQELGRPVCRDLADGWSRTHGLSLMSQQDLKCAPEGAALRPRRATRQPAAAMVQDRHQCEGRPRDDPRLSPTATSPRRSRRDPRSIPFQQLQRARSPQRKR